MQHEGERGAPPLRTGPVQARKPRDGRGRFSAGSSGNPGGRPKANAPLKRLARDLTEPTIKRLGEIVRNGGEKAAVGAAQVILAYGWGRPTSDAIERTEVLELMGKLGLAVDQYVTDPQVRQRIADHWAALYGVLVGPREESAKA